MEFKAVNVGRFAFTAMQLLVFRLHIYFYNVNISLSLY